jgi:integration host factor subunit beta
MEKLTKAEILSSISDSTGSTKDEIHLIIDSVMDEIKSALDEGKVVELRGFGTLEIRRRNAKAVARNPRTGETTSSEAHGVVCFRPGKELKEKCWDLRHQIEIPSEIMYGLTRFAPFALSTHVIPAPRRLRQQRWSLSWINQKLWLSKVRR